MKIFIAAIILLAVIGCSPSTQPRNIGRDLSGEHASPDGNYILRTHGFSIDHENNGNQWWYAKFQILDSQGNVLFDDTEDFATWFPLQAKWVASNRVAILSRDVGDLQIEQLNDVWTRTRTTE